MLVQVTFFCSYFFAIDSRGRISYSEKLCSFCYILTTYFVEMWSQFMVLLAVIIYLFPETVSVLVCVINNYFASLMSIYNQ